MEYFEDDINLSKNRLNIKDPNRHFEGQSVQSILEQTEDNIKHVGFEYRDSIFEKTMSNVLFLEPKRASILKMFDKVWIKLVDEIKMIKKTFNFTLDKNYRNFN